MLVWTTEPLIGATDRPTPTMKLLQRQELQVGPIDTMLYPVHRSDGKIEELIYCLLINYLAVPLPKCDRVKIPCILCLF